MKPTKQLIVIFLIAMALTVAGGCSKGKIFEKYHKFENNAWKRIDDNVLFEVPVKDTAAFYDIILAIRHATFYPYDYISIGLASYSPSGEMRYSEHKIQLKNESGVFLSKGLGDIWDMEVPIKKKYLFNRAGVFKFEIENLTGNKYLVPGVMEIGLIVVKTK